MEPSNILHIESLNEDWRDKDNIILHACFQLLKDCVEKEDLLSGGIDWNFNNKYRFARVEIEKLYHWWLSYKDLDIFDQNRFELENEMLIRLINVRWALWT